MNHNFYFLEPLVTGQGRVIPFGFYFINQWTASESSTSCSSDWHFVFIFPPFLTISLLSHLWFWNLLMYMYSFNNIQQQTRCWVLWWLSSWISGFNSSLPCSIMYILILFMASWSEECTFMLLVFRLLHVSFFLMMGYSIHALSKGLNCPYSFIIAMTRIAAIPLSNGPQYMVHGTEMPQPTHTSALKQCPLSWTTDVWMKSK